MISRREWLAGAPALLQRRPPNFVFVLVDDWRYDFASALGHEWVRTPNLDRAIRGGVHFANAFVTSSLCSPSRASMLTGLYAHKHGVVDNFTPLDDRLPTFPRLLRENGYRTGFIGKWHMGGASDEQRPGFDDWVSFFGQGAYFDPELNRNGRRAKAAGYMTDLLTEEALAFVKRNRERPHCLYLSHKAIHFPFEPAPRHKTLYANAPVRLPASAAARAGQPEWVKKRRESRQGLDGMYDRVISFAEAQRGYARSLAAVDESVGAVLDAVDPENTVFVLMGDNGFLWGEQGLIDKRAMYEPSIRVPLAIHAPARFQARREERFALNLDIAPTLLDLAGVRAPAMHGSSLRPLLEGRDAPWREDFVYEYDWEFDYPYTPTLTGIRTGRHSYCQTFGVWDVNELYDVREDPAQMKNLVGEARIVRQRGRATELIADVETKALVGRLQARMAEILRTTGGDARRAGVTPDGWRSAL